MASYETRTRRFSRAGPEWYVRTEGPIGLDDDSEPEPTSRSSPAIQTITAAPTLHGRSSPYARAGLSDYWVLNLIDRVLEVYREPAPDSAAPFGWRYTRSEVFDATARLTPLAAPGSRVPVSQLLP